MANAKNNFRMSRFSCWPFSGIFFFFSVPRVSQTQATESNSTAFQRTKSAVTIEASNKWKPHRAAGTHLLLPGSCCDLGWPPRLQGSSGMVLMTAIPQSVAVPRKPGVESCSVFVVTVLWTHVHHQHHYFLVCKQ